MQLSGQPLYEAIVAVGEGLGVVAAGHLGQHPLQGNTEILEVGGLEAISLSVLFTQVVDQGHSGVRVIQNSDQGVQAIDDTQDVGLELRAVDVFHVDSLEQGLGCGVDVEEFLEDGCANLGSLACVLSTPDGLPQGLYLMPVLDGTALVGRSQAKSSHNHSQYQHLESFRCSALSQQIGRAHV